MENKRISKFLSSFSVNEISGCWVWEGELDKTGYGKFYADLKNNWAHRISFLIFKGDLEKGLEIDHLCRNRRCINPRHLEQVTKRENILRGQSFSAKNAVKTSCKRGHLFDGSNTYISRCGKKRSCRKCHAESERNRQKRLKESVEKSFDTETGRG